MDPLVITLRPITAQIGILKEKPPSALILLIVEIRSLWASCGLEPFKFWSSSMGKTQLWPHQLHSKPGCLHFTFLAILDPKISTSSLCFPEVPPRSPLINSSNHFSIGLTSQHSKQFYHITQYLWSLLPSGSSHELLTHHGTHDPRDASEPIAKRILLPTRTFYLTSAPNGSSHDRCPHGRCMMNNTSLPQARYGAVQCDLV